MSESWWITVSGSSLAQGDLLPDCLMPVFTDPTPRPDNAPVEIQVKTQRLIVVTQSCDLENNKIEFVALCPIHTLDEFAEPNVKFKKRKNYEGVRKGTHHALHMLASPEDPDNNDRALVVDFGQIVGLPLSYLAEHAGSLGERNRLRSPYLEHFSQAFARFFMRVGLPSSIPEFK